MLHPAQSYRPKGYGQLGWLPDDRRAQVAFFGIDQHTLVKLDSLKISTISP
jgi:hypothetical protein